MRIGALFVLLLCLPLTVIVAYQGIMIDVAVHKDILGWLDRAKAATTAEDMAYFIDEALKGLDKWGMQEGTWEWLYVNPSNYMEYSRRILQSLRDRCIEIEGTQTRGSMGYAESLEEIKRAFNSIAVDPWRWYTLRHAPWVYYWWALLPAVWIPSLIISVIDETDFRCRLGLHSWRVERRLAPTMELVPVYMECRRCWKRREVPKDVLEKLQRGG